MYIIKNAMRNIMRAKGRNILIGCIAFVIGLSACLALSIKQAAVNEKESGLANINISATIGVDRQAMMEKVQESGDTSDSQTQRSDMKEQMQGMQSLTLEEMQTYAKADSVKNFYYTNSVSLNSSSVEAVLTTTSSESSVGETNEGKGFIKGGMENQGDFRFTGYSSYDAMTTFDDTTNTLTSGDLFEEGSDDATCVINKELATLNSIAIGDKLTFVNPNNTEETFTIKVVGIYTSSEASSDESSFMNMAMMDPANQIYMSYDGLQQLVEKSEDNLTNTSSDTDTTLRSMTSGTYVFQDVDAYESFEEEARTLGLSEEYSVTSSDVSAYEQSLQPLLNLSTYATYFLFVIVTIGGIILVVLNIYRVRERKYEIGVLAAIGMNKTKVAIQFVIEIFVTTIFAIMIGTGIGAIASVPVTNALLTTQSTTSDTQGFEKPNGNMGGRTQSMPNAMGTQTSYIEEIRSATDLNVVIQLVGIGVLLTLLSGGVAVMSILRYEPLKILSSRE